MTEWPSTGATRVLAALLRIGWTVKRQTGSHRVLARPGWPDVVFPLPDGEEIGPRMLAASRNTRVFAPTTCSLLALSPQALILQLQSIVDPRGVAPCGVGNDSVGRVLVAPPPRRPSQGVRETRRSAPDDSAQEMPHFGERQREHGGEAHGLARCGCARPRPPLCPLSERVCARTTVRYACAKRSRVM
jgi:predicted RNA binding protein YcfA (HicA-like mRNA interferase family)